MSAAAPQWVSQGEGCYLVRGELTFATASVAYASGERGLAQSASKRVTLDCSGLTAADSAGLAVLLEWIALARSRGIELRCQALPDFLLRLARISEVEAFISA